MLELGFSHHDAASRCGLGRVFGEREDVGDAPGLAGCCVFDYVAGVVAGVEGAFLSECGDGVPGGFQAAGGWVFAEMARDNQEPEAGEGFVVAGGPMSAMAWLKVESGSPKSPSQWTLGSRRNQVSWRLA